MSDGIEIADVWLRRDLAPEGGGVHIAKNALKGNCDGVRFFGPRRPGNIEIRET